jgi:hypothetical protein
VQLLRLRPALDGSDVLYVTVGRERRADVGAARFAAIPDATRWNKIRLLWLAIRMAWIMVRFWPGIVITTGAASGYFAVRIGRLMGARTLWIDSIANAEEMSLSGRMAVRHASLSLTQWPHLAREGGPQYRGAVL